jgi:uncharacterized protein Usg
MKNVVSLEHDLVEAPACGPGGMPSPGFLARLAGWGLTTAEILYRMPDHPRLLQTFIWQEYDLAPHFPTLKRFLTFWQEQLEGPLFSVRIGHERLLRSAEIKAVGGEFRLH